MTVLLLYQAVTAAFSRTSFNAEMVNFNNSMLLLDIRQVQAWRGLLSYDSPFCGCVALILSSAVRVF